MIIIDNVVMDPGTYRKEALAREYKTHEGFSGIAVPGGLGVFTKWIDQTFALTSTTTFFRKSPRDQPEPNYIHSDLNMGTWTAILYLNPFPPMGDATYFYRHKKSGQTVDDGTGTLDGDWTKRSHWERNLVVRAQFNRVLIFPANRYHSRGIPENYGTGDDARLIQVVFGTGSHPAVMDGVRYVSDPSLVENLK